MKGSMYFDWKWGFFKLSIINAHATTEDKKQDEKEQFYYLLNRTYDKAPL
jgi:hypothetical protein